MKHLLNLVVCGVLGIFYCAQGGVDVSLIDQQSVVLRDGLAGNLYIQITPNREIVYVPQKKAATIFQRINKQTQQTRDYNPLKPRIGKAILMFEDQFLVAQDGEILQFIPQEQDWSYTFYIGAEKDLLPQATKDKKRLSMSTYFLIAEDAT